MTQPIPCPRAGRWFRGCRFEARYDEVPRRLDDEEFAVFAVCGPTWLRDAMTLRTYIRDVCTRCGATIERNSP